MPSIVLVVTGRRRAVARIRAMVSGWMAGGCVLRRPGRGRGGRSLPALLLLVHRRRRLRVTPILRHARWRRLGTPVRRGHGVSLVAVVVVPQALRMRPGPAGRWWRCVMGWRAAVPAFTLAIEGPTDVVTVPIGDDRERY